MCWSSVGETAGLEHWKWFIPKTWAPSQWWMDLTLDAK